MEKKYYLHRISHEGNVSYSLLEKGILSLGWSKFTDSGILEAAREEGYTHFNQIAAQNGEGHSRSRWCMWYFAQMEVGDTVVVPLYGGKFSVFEVEERAKEISELEGILTEVYGAWDEHPMIWKNHKLYDVEEDRAIDLGFIVKVKPIIKDVPRKYAIGKLFSRMKIQITNSSINDIADQVEKSIDAGKKGKPVSLYEESIEKLAKELKKQIIVILQYNKFEHLIKWYIEKCGAEYSVIPAKNEPGKSDGADADIIAEFRSLKHIIYIQAKLHEGETSEWAVHQIDEYFKQKSEGDSDYSYARWVISMCDSYSEEAVNLAKESNVRLIDGEEFARMLIDIGLLNIDEAFEK